MNKYINSNHLIQDIELSRANNNHNNAIASQTHNAEHRHFIRMVLDQPAADVVEVVRCKDCVFCEESQGACNYCKLHDCRFDKNGFCSYGEKR